MTRRAQGEGSLIRRGKIWWIYYYVDGAQVAESSKSPKKSVAGDLLRARRNEIKRGITPAPARKDKVTFETLEALYLVYLERRGSASVATVKGAFNHMRPWFGGLPAEALTLERFEAYWTESKKKMKPATIRDYLGYLRSAFNQAAARKLIAYVPTFPRISVSNARETFIKDQDWNAIVVALPDYLKRFYGLQYLIGCRKGTAAKLTWDRNVDWDEKLLVFHPDQVKSKKAQVIPFDEFPELEDLLRSQLAYRKGIEDDWGVAIPTIFFRPRSKVRRVNPVGDSRKEWRKACKLVGISGIRKEGGITPHDFRRAAARRLDMELKVPRAAAKKIIGHSTNSMYDRYAAIAVDEDVREAVRALSAGIRAARAKGPRISSSRHSLAEPT